MLRTMEYDAGEYGRQEVIDLLLGHGSVGEHLKRVIMAEKDLEILRTWLKTAAAVDSVEEFEASNMTNIMDVI